MKRFQYTPDPIPNLVENEVMVFGANQLGQHGGGSAKAAHNFYGAVLGEVHRTGRCYGIITLLFDDEANGIEAGKPTQEYLEKEFELFFKQVELEKEKEFLLTKIGLGIAGWSIEEVKTAFWKHYNSAIHTNVTFPIEFELTEIDL